MRGRTCKIGGMVSGEIPGRGGDYPCSIGKKARRMDPIVPVWRYTMRATDDLQTTITLGSVKPDGQTFSLELSLEMSLPMPRQDEHLRDQIEAYVHHAGLEHQLTASERKSLARITRGQPLLCTLRGLMEEVYRLFDRRCRTATALAKLAK